MAKIRRKHVAIRERAAQRIHEELGVNFAKPGVNTVTVHSRDVRTNEIKLEEKTHNLIVYHGRSWMMQRAFGLNLGAIGTESQPQPWYYNDTTGPGDIQRRNWNDMYINWLAVGEGGAVSGSPLSPESVKSTEYEMITHSNIGYSNADPTGLSSNLRYTHPTGFDATPHIRDYHEFDATYPMFLYDPDVVPGGGGTVDPNYAEMQVTDHTGGEILYGGYKTDSYLRALVRVTLAPEECNGDSYYDPAQPGNDYRDLNEAALFVSPSYDAATVLAATPATQNQVEMFAKVNFSTIRKDDTREIILSWYVYF